MANFESFNRHMLPLKDGPHVTIHRRGTISVNRSAFDGLGSPDAVELLFDRERSVVGLRPIDSHADNAYQVRHGPNGPWVVSAMAFTKFYDIDTSTTSRWPATIEDGVLCTDISAPGTPVGKQR
jgi:hypothetical protein